MKGKSRHNQQQEESDKHFISRLQWLLFAQLCLENVLGQKLKSKINSNQQTLNLFTWLYSVQHSTSNTIAAVTRNKHTQRFLHIYPLCVFVCVWVFVPHPFKALACIMTHQRQPQRQSDKDGQRQIQGERDSRHIPKWTTGKLQSYVLCTSCHINYAQMLCGCVCGSVCQSNFSLALLLKCEWQLDALIVTMNCISSAIPCSVYATADSC